MGSIAHVPPGTGRREAMRLAEWRNARFPMPLVRGTTLPKKGYCEYDVFDQRVRGNNAERCCGNIRGTQLYGRFRADGSDLGRDQLPTHFATVQFH